MAVAAGDRQAGRATTAGHSVRTVRAVRYEAFGGPITVAEVPEPQPPPHGVVLAVEASGLCRSDVHAWRGHDPLVAPPITPGHELVGRITALGPQVRRWRVGQRVTTPFVCACGACPECARGDGQVCRDQTQPGFTHDGSFAQALALHHADANLVAVPDDVEAGAAALLGCRFATAHRGLVLARVAAGESVLVLGCGGVGLSAVMLAVALGAQVVAVDVEPAALRRAAALGAAATVDASDLPSEQVADAVRALHPEGVAVSVDAAGSGATIDAALLSLARRGRHVQIGLVATEPVVRVSRVVSHEIAVLGSHGMDAREYPPLVDLVRGGRLRPQDLVTAWIGLEEVPAAMAAMAASRAPAGVTMIRP